MAQWWVYAGAGFVGLLWGGGYIQPAVALAFIVGLLMGAGSDIVKGAILALIGGYIAGSIMIKKR